MTVSLRDARSQERDQRWIASLEGDYLQDLAGASTGIHRALSRLERSEPAALVRWLDDRQNQVLLILDDGRPAGFAVVTATSTASTAFQMTEFFISRAERRRGLGLAAAQLLLRRFSGQWQVDVQSNNVGAVSFWRRVARFPMLSAVRERRESGEIRFDWRSGAVSGSAAK